MPEGQRQKADWIDETVEGNGIGPVCRHCERLIDRHPLDHAPGCVAWGSTPALGWFVQSDLGIIGRVVSISNGVITIEC